MAGLVPAIHAVETVGERPDQAPTITLLSTNLRAGVDGQDKPGHDLRYVDPRSEAWS